MAQKTIPEKIISRRRFVRVSPDKVRFAAALLKGKSLVQALAILKFSRLAAAKSLELTIKQGLSQAKDQSMDGDRLKINQILVNEGPRLKRRRMIHQGRSVPILKRMSHLAVVIGKEKNGS